MTLMTLLRFSLFFSFSGLARMFLAMSSFKVCLHLFCEASIPMIFVAVVCCAHGRKFSLKLLLYIARVTTLSHNVKLCSLYSSYIFVILSSVPRKKFSAGSSSSIVSFNLREWFDVFFNCFYFFSIGFVMLLVISSRSTPNESLLAFIVQRTVYIYASE